MIQTNYTPFDPILLNGQFTPISKPLETEPTRSTEEILRVQEAVEHIPEKEILPYVKARPEVVKLPPDLKKATGAETIQSTKFPSYQDLALPLSDEKIEQGIHKPVTSSFRWLAELCIYILKQAHLTLKTIHGKIIRVKN